MAIDNLTATAIAEFDAVARGRGLGHTRTDLGFPPFVRFRHLRPLPFTVVYDERTNVVLRIIGARGLHEHTVFADFDRA